MHDLVKLALSPTTVAAMVNATKGFGSGAGMGGLIGAGLGAAGGALRGAHQAREQGGSGLTGGLAGAARGTIRGAAAGALVGGAGGALAPALAARASALPSLSGASRFGQRQIHSLTGVGDAAYVRSIGGGAADARQNLVEATKGLRDAPDVATRAQAMEKVRAARQGFKASEKAEGMGLTSIPGYLQSMTKDPLGTLATGAKAQWQTASPAMRAGMVALPALGAANELRKGEEQEGRGRFERAGRAVGGTASGLLAPLALAGDMAFGGGLASGAGLMGRGLDRSLARLRVRRGETPISSQEPSAGIAQPAGYALSDRAAGTAAESVTG